MVYTKFVAKILHVLLKTKRAFAFFFAYEEGYGTTMLRRILGTVSIDQRNDNWLRLKIVNTLGGVSNYDQFAFSLDFIELVPTSVVNNPNFSEDWY